MTTIRKHSSCDVDIYTGAVVMRSVHSVIFDGDGEKLRYYSEYRIDEEILEDLSDKGGPDAVRLFAAAVAQCSSDDLATEEQLRSLKPRVPGEAVEYKRATFTRYAPGMAITEESLKAGDWVAGLAGTREAFRAGGYIYVMDRSDPSRINFIAVPTE